MSQRAPDRVPTCYINEPGTVMLSGLAIKWKDCVLVTYRWRLYSWLLTTNV